MIRWIYDLGFLLFGIFSLPHFLGRLKQAEDPKQLLRERLGLFSPECLEKLAGKRPLWIHAVSVGEVLAVEKLIQLIKAKKPEISTVLTTVTPTGQQLAKKWEGEGLHTLYFPFDIRMAVSRFFEALKPRALLLVETEIWPNVIEEAKRHGVPIGVINGRLSERSFRAFRLFSGLFRPLLSQVHFFLVQTEQDRERLLRLGVDETKVRVTGNMKLDAFELEGDWKDESDTLRRKWGFSPSDQILIGGSTHAGEEEILLKSLRHLRKEGLPVKLLLAPRHIERAEEVLKLSNQHGFKTLLATEYNDGTSLEVLILNKLGELRNLYSVADVVVMGGSLVRRGGQNPIEAARFRKAVIHGPWVFNFYDIYKRLDEEKGSLMVQGESELTLALRRLLSSEAERQQLGNRAYEILEKLRGATEQNFNWIEEFLLDHLTKVSRGDFR
ncbi:MAG: 3-deoxy-D-manno-octulosonic acid transferase [Candidatus Omnitrophica bacterium]|nr:3-deoxy-D-manno-octulosonic acid transferase [Candidatus Omnitrophota bacterium]